MNKADLENAPFEEMSTNSNSSKNEYEIIPFKDDEPFVSGRIHRPKPTKNIKWATYTYNESQVHYTPRPK